MVENGPTPPEQGDLFEEEAEEGLAKSFLDRLIGEARLYRTGKDYAELLDFVSRLRLFAPFNATLLHLQKPGLLYAASQSDWWNRFGRELLVGARPLLIMKPFGPVALVYDVADTVGPDLPVDVDPFGAVGAVDETVLRGFRERLERSEIAVTRIDTGAGSAGSIRRSRERERGRFFVILNRNHEPAAEFTTLAHELAHLFLGHLGEDRRFKIKSRIGLSLAQRELEAESVAYLVGKRNGVESRSHPYLAGYVDTVDATEQLSLDRIMVATGKIESLLGIAAQARFDAISRGNDLFVSQEAA